VPILGVRVDDVTYGEALAILLDALDRRQPCAVTTPNPEIVMLAHRDAGFRGVLNRCGLNIPDGIGLLLAARLAGDRLREHVQGTDLVALLAASSIAGVNVERASRAPRWFLLGGRGDVAQRASQVLRRQYPGLEVVGAMPGSAEPTSDLAVRAAIQRVAPVDVILVAYGAPRQERWLDRNLATLQIPVGIGVGGVFNYLSGDAPRAPRWLRRWHLEWLHRLITQPWRWRRQLQLPVFAALVLGEGLARRRRRRQARQQSSSSA
jgi:N-acetylglucosaminyldiphosphoundecaprenol N-acetyl-beta-D-mannosaminyltransferase